MKDEEFNFQEVSEYFEEKKSKCDCGSVSTYGPNATHTHYCSLYKKGY
jgi:hypothetical protein